jgi:hypothetical protein
MKTSTKLSVVAAFLLSATSLLGTTSMASAACGGGCCAAPPAPPHKIHIFCVRATSVNDVVLFGGGSVGSNRNLGSALQNSRNYPHGPDPLKGEYLIAVWCPTCAPPPPPTPCCR